MRVLLCVVVASVLLAACSGGGSADGGESTPDDGSGDGGGQAAETTTTAPIRDAVPAASGASVDLGLAGPHLAVVVDEGGRCESGACFVVVEFAADGTWLLTDSVGETAEGGYDAEALADLARDARGDDINLGPFRGECPTTFDGNERSYQVFSPEDPKMTVLDLASCRDQIDADAPIMVALDLLVLEASR